MTEDSSRIASDQPGGPPPAGEQPSAPPGPEPPPAGPHATPGAAGFTSRYGLVRPYAGRYLAGVCAAIGRATGTDPVLWRVLLAVLGFFGGVGVLAYVAAWLIIPGEGDDASPIESMLGRGRSSMSPLTVIVLTILAAVSFGFIVSDGFRAMLLGAAVLVGAALLLSRQHNADARTHGMPSASAPPHSGTAPDQQVPDPAPRPAGPTLFPPAAPVSSMASPGAPPPTGSTPLVGVGTGHQPVGAPPGYPPPGYRPPVGPPAAPAFAPPAGSGYRPPFAPHGPYAGPGPVAPQRSVPKPPRQRSPLGAVTFCLILIACGAVTFLDLLGLIRTDASTYFATTLTVIGLGLLVGTWFGRARWLIALGLVTAAALGIATATEPYRDWRTDGPNVVWTPVTHDAIAPTYRNAFDAAQLDLRAVDFTGRESRTVVEVAFGGVSVLLPPNVDVVTTTETLGGDAYILGNRVRGRHASPITDTGVDGPGGGTLHLTIKITAGYLEVTR